MSQKCPQIGQEPPNMAPSSPSWVLLGAMLGASWPIWGAILGHLVEKAAKQKTLKKCPNIFNYRTLLDWNNSLRHFLFPLGWVNFFNKNALTTTLPAQLSLKFNLDIIPVFIERTKNNNFIIEFHPPINSKNYQNKFDLSEALNRILENMVTKNPYQWIWTHDRWK